MEEIENKHHLYTKGDRETVIRRFDMIHTLTMFCPIVDEGIKIFKNNLLTCLTQYMEKKDYFKQVPVMDVFVCFNKTLDYCKNNNISIDNIYSFWGVVQSFKNLKFLNLEFTSDENVLYAYEYIRGKEKDKSFEIIQHIYKIEVIELVLSNMFTQNVIDMLNKVMMFDEIISNSYLEREFIIVFDYDDYISFMDMFATNNGMELAKLDDYIIDYLLLFPKIISNSKPTIRLLTNYSEL